MVTENSTPDTLLGAIKYFADVETCIAFVAALTDDQNRTLHDRIVGTIVVPAD